MRVLIIVLMILSISVSGCMTKIITTCRIHPKLNQETEASVGSLLVQKEGCGRRQEWHGLAGGGMVTITECQTAELIYLGKSGDFIRIGYKEFVNNLARPAYSMEVTYPATSGQLIFQNTLLEILEIAPNHIKYRILRTPTEGCDEVYFW